MSSKTDFQDRLPTLLPEAGHVWTARLGGIAVRVAADGPEPIAYLRRFARCEQIAPSLELVQVTDTALIEELELAAGPTTPSKIAEVFTGTRYEALQLPGASSVPAFRRVGGAAHWVLPQPGGAVSLVATKDEESTRAPIRLLREFLLREAEEHLVLHGAAVADADGAVLLLGPSGSGKSTLALAVAEHCGLDLVGNDYLFVRHGEISALPVVYRLGAGTVRGSAALAAALPSMGAPRPGIVVSPGARGAEGVEVYGSSLKYEIPPATVAELLGCDLAPAGDIRTVILCQMEPGDQPLTLVEIDHADSLPRARDELRIPVGEPWLRPWVAPRRKEPDELRRRAEERLSELLAHSRVLRLRVGVQWFAAHQQAVAEQLLAARESR
jgi:hypothetical protein